MIPEAFSRRSITFASVLLLGPFIAASFGQDGGAFGMEGFRLASILAARNAEDFPALNETELADTGSYGPAAYYYLGRWFDDLPPASTAAPTEASARARSLYRAAFDRGSGLLRREAGTALLANLSSSRLWEELLAFSADYSQALGSAWKSERPRLDALDALGRNTELSSLTARLRTAYPAEAGKDYEALAYFGAAAELRGPASKAGSSWRRTFRRSLLERPYSEWTARAYLLVGTEQKLCAAFSEEELHALAMRDAVWRKDYGRAYSEALLAPNVALSRSAAQAMVADAGKAFLYSGAMKEGQQLFAAIEAAATKAPTPTGASAGVAWTALYYRARFARALEHWEEAAELFGRAAAKAPAKGDADSAAWYAADCAYRGAIAAATAAGPAGLAASSSARAALLEALIAASNTWREPETFVDLANGLFRDALRARDWPLLAAMDERLGPKLDSATAARLSFTSARAYELGLDGNDADPAKRAAAAAARFAAIIDKGRFPLYYRALAAWRADLDIPVLRPEPATEEIAQSPEAANENEAFVAGMASFGLGDLALAEARARRTAIGEQGLRRLAATFSALGRPDCALRLEVDLSYRPSFEPRRADYELLYPRPFLDEFRSLGLEDKLPEGLALGLVRSESVFRVDVVSHAGAIGLSQLMPATAADQARALRLESYDLKNPADNLKIGLAHYITLLERADGRPLRAMMAYNAGSGRLRIWLSESGELPDDLLVEAIGIEETRQYCRNILQSTVMYGSLYYGKNVGETVAYVVEGKKP
jgi:soluble lytic murein transglycosylase-like protein